MIIYAHRWITARRSSFRQNSQPILAALTQPTNQFLISTAASKAAVRERIFKISLRLENLCSIHHLTGEKLNNEEEEGGKNDRRT